MRSIFVKVLCAVFAIQLVAGIVIWAACPANCTCAKPVQARCNHLLDAVSGACTPHPDAANTPCSGKSRVTNHNGLFSSAPDATAETNIGIDTSRAQVNCVTINWCDLDNSGNCVLLARIEVQKTFPLRAVPCSAN
jgi:hypothetical protein